MINLELTKEEHSELLRLIDQAVYNAGLLTVKNAPYFKNKLLKASEEIVEEPKNDGTPS